MTLDELLQHFALRENPFRGEEARTDNVFARMTTRAEPWPVGVLEASPARNPHTPVGSNPLPTTAPAVLHADFEKIIGDLRHPGPAVVFGEKGSGKTAIRLQIAERVAAHNLAHPGDRVLLIPYDDLNGVLARFHERMGGKPPMEAFQRFRLVDHLDAILAHAVPRVVDAFLGRESPVDLAAEPRKAVKRLDRPTRRDLLLLQALYDRPDEAPRRTVELASRLGLRRPLLLVLGDVVAVLAPVVLLAGSGYEYFELHKHPAIDWFWWLVGGGAALWILFILKQYVVDRLINLGVARRIRRQIRVLARGDVSFARSLRRLEGVGRQPSALPVSDSDEPRYEALERLARVARAIGYTSILIVVDRVDEPTLVSGDAERMRAVVWPLLNNKFLQQPGIGVKLLLPIELRHALFKESNAFFQEARLDKQSMVERLSWSGATLYDLCTARLNACRFPDLPPIALVDLFAPDVSRQDVEEALGAVHQPRDAFKLLYRCMTEHCARPAGLAAASPGFRIDRSTLEIARKLEVERVQQLYRGIRPG